MPALMLSHESGRTLARTLTAAVLAAVVLVLAAASTLLAAQATVRTPEVSTPAGQPRDLFRKAPYLICNGQPDEMEIHWQLVATAPCTLSWGTDPSCSDATTVTSQYWAVHQHKYTITHLEEDTVYHYRVTDGDAVWQDTFRTPPAPDATQLKFLAYGDTRSYPANHDDVAAGMLDLIDTDPAYQTMVILAGDLVNDGNSDADWDTQFFDPARLNIRRFHATVPTLAARGNHEGSALYFMRYLPYPFVDATYWSYDYGPAHFVVIDQYVDYTPGSAQYEWLVADLEVNDKPWTFMYLHEPGWSAGGSHGNEMPVQWYLHPLCEQYDIPILFAGHNHYYARCLVGDVHHITTGGGGAPLGTPNPSYPYVVATASAYHFCKIEIDDNLLTCTIVEPDGTIVDQFTVDRTWTGAEPLPDHRLLAMTSPAPNPFSEDTTLSLTLSEPAHVNVSVYDVRGRRLATLLDAPRGAGRATCTWDGRTTNGEVASGVYFVRGVATGIDGAVETIERRLILMR